MIFTEQSNNNVSKEHIVPPVPASSLISQMKTKEVKVKTERQGSAGSHPFQLVQD